MFKYIDFRKQVKVMGTIKEDENPERKLNFFDSIFYQRQQC